MYQNTKTLSKSMQRIAELSDAHCHLNMFNDPEGIVNLSEMHGVKLMITAGGSGKDNIQVDRLAKIEDVFGVIGISPDFAKTDFGLIEEIPKLVKGNSKIVGIGEIGLDYKITENPAERERQKEVFEKQIELAKGMDLPLVIHSRGAFEDVMRILVIHSVKKVMFHFFEGGMDEAKDAERKGYIISVPPVETNKRRNAIKALGLKNIVAETDSPVVGETPADVQKSIQIISDIKEIDAGEVAQITTENLREFFYI